MRVLKNTVLEFESKKKREYLESVFRQAAEKKLPPSRSNAFSPFLQKL